MQILVVVAHIQMRILKTEVENASVRTSIGHGRVDPKKRVNFGDASVALPPHRKGMMLILINQDVDIVWQRKRIQ